MKIKFRISFIMILIFVLVFSSLSFATIPEDTIIIGSKAFALDCIFDSSFNDDINEALFEAGGTDLYYRLTGQNQFYDLMNGEPIDNSKTEKWPEITLIKADRSQVIYEAGNGAEKDAVKVLVSVEVGSIESFKKVTVHSTDIDEAVSFMINGNKMQLGEEMNIMTSENIVEVDLLDLSDGVVGTFDLDVSNNITDKSIVISEGSDSSYESLKVISID